MVQKIVLCCVLVDPAARTGWLVRDWSLDLSSCEVGEFASQTGSPQGGIKGMLYHLCLHLQVLHSTVEHNRVSSNKHASS